MEKSDHGAGFDFETFEDDEGLAGRLSEDVAFEEIPQGTKPQELPQNAGSPPSHDQSTEE